jgi:hypothetical protein
MSEDTDAQLEQATSAVQDTMAAVVKVCRRVSAVASAPGQLASDGLVPTDQPHHHQPGTVRRFSQLEMPSAATTAAGHRALSGSSDGDL